MSVEVVISVPRFPILGEPGDWDELTLSAATIFLECEGEPEDGQVAVAWVIRRRADEVGSVRKAILGPEGRAYGDARPYEPFSCFGDDYKERARARLAAADKATWAWRAAAAGLWKLGADPSKGAYFYLNVALTKKGRGDGTLPSWAALPGDATKINESKVLAVLGRHHFLKA